MKKTVLTFAVLASMVIPVVPVSAKTVAPKLSRTNISMKTGSKVTIKIKKANPKKTTWKISKAAKKYVSLTSKKKKSVVIKAKKAGTVTLKARVSYKGKVKTLKAKIKITNKKSGTSSANQSTDDTEDSYSVITTNLKASLTEKGYVKLSWDKMSGASTYFVYRKETGKSGWKKVRTSETTTATDFNVKENTRYMYRVQGDRDEDYKRYSNTVSIRTGEVKNEEENVTVPVGKTEETETSEEKTEETANEPEEEEYQAKYTYEAFLLNKFNIYPNTFMYGPVVIYIKTDSPYEPNYKGWGVLDGYKIEDLEFIEDSGYGFKVRDGYILEMQLQTYDIGTKTIEVYEKYEEAGELKTSEKPVCTFSFEVKDPTVERQKWAEQVIKTVSDDNYTSTNIRDTTNGLKWSELSDSEKMTRLEQYIISNFHYPLKGTYNETWGGYNAVFILQENVGANWETGFADCGAANSLLKLLANTIGIEADVEGSWMYGGYHIRTKAVIDGEICYYDATPYQGGYQDWEPIELP